MILPTLVQVTMIMFIYMTCGFVIAQIKKDNSIADVFWGLGFVIIALYSFFKTNLFLPRHLLVTSLVFIWGVRLSGYILYRNWGKKEDPRYQAWKQQWGRYAVLLSFLLVFILQGFFMLCIDYSTLLINVSTNPDLNILDLTGLSLWLIGFAFEVVSDWQLHKFLRNPANKGKIMDQGLWHYTRHPNYFGELCMWWGIWLIALSVPYGWTGIISPLTISYILMFISTPVTERQFTGNLAYEQYKKKTNAIFPWIPKEIK